MKIKSQSDIKRQAISTNPISLIKIPANCIFTRENQYVFLICFTGTINTGSIMTKRQGDELHQSEAERWPVW